jgi:hypothetical protein
MWVKWDGRNVSWGCKAHSRLTYYDTTDIRLRSKTKGMNDLLGDLK